MTRPSWAPPEIDLDRPSAARVYDFYLGGFHNFPADRAMAQEAIRMWPELPVMMQANRAFLRRAIRFAVGRGITQFLDIGSGIPTVGNSHEVARQADPACRVVYVDIDPIAVAHSRAILGDDPATLVLQGDLRRARGDPGGRTRARDCSISTVRSPCCSSRCCILCRTRTTPRRVDRTAVAPPWCRAACWSSHTRVPDGQPELARVTKVVRPHTDADDHAVPGEIESCSRVRSCRNPVSCRSSSGTPNGVGGRTGDRADGRVRRRGSQGVGTLGDRWADSGEAVAPSPRSGRAPSRAPATSPRTGRRSRAC